MSVKKKIFNKFFKEEIKKIEEEKSKALGGLLYDYAKLKGLNKQVENDLKSNKDEKEELKKVLEKKHEEITKLQEIISKHQGTEEAVAKLLNNAVSTLRSMESLGLTKKDVNFMAGDEYERRLKNEPGFKEKVDKLFADEVVRSGR